MAVGLTIDGQSFDVPGAWEHDLSLARLVVDVATRGANRLVPGTAGVIPRPIRTTELLVDLQLEVFGDKNQAGVAHANEFDGLMDNLIFLRGFVTARADGVETTQAAVLDTGSRSFTTDVQIINWRLARHALTVAFISYDLRIPSGVWTEIP